MSTDPFYIWFADSQTEKPGFISYKFQIYLSTVLESLDQMQLGSVEILSATNILSLKAQVQRNFSIKFSVGLTLNTQMLVQ